MAWKRHAARGCRHTLPPHCRGSGLQDWLTVLWLGDAQLFLRPLHRDLHTDIHQLRQSLGVGRHVLGLAHVQLKNRASAHAVRRQAVEQGQRVQQVSGDRAANLPDIAVAQVFAHLVMHVAQRVGAALAIRTTGQRAAKDHLGLGALAPVEHQLKSLGVARGRVQKIQLHARRDDACRVVANAHQRPQQRHLLLFAGAAGVFADANRDAVDLQKLSQVAHAVVLEQVGPHQLSEHGRAL